MPAKVVWMDVDHAGEPILTIGTRDAPVEVGTLTVQVIVTVGAIRATGILIGTATGDIEIGTWTAMEPGVAATARRW